MKSRGYTIMEVMAALAVLAVGASGVVALQKVTVIGNRNAKTLSTANGVATTWIERLRIDSAHWTSSTTLANTVWLNRVETGWFVPTAGMTALLGSPKADVMGADIFDGDTSATAFCTHVRLTYMGAAATATLMRAEVRVFWSREGAPVTDPECDDAAAIAHPDPKFGYAMYTTGVSLREPLQ